MGFTQTLKLNKCAASPKQYGKQKHYNSGSASARAQQLQLQRWATIWSQYTCVSLPAELCAVQICRYLVYSEADFEVFRPAGATCCTNGGEIWQDPQN